MRERNHIVRVYLNDRELAHLEKCLSKTHWGKEAFLRAAIRGTGIATKPPEDCQEIIDRLREIGDRLNVLPLGSQSCRPRKRRHSTKRRVKSGGFMIWYGMRFCRRIGITCEPLSGWEAKNE